MSDDNFTNYYFIPCLRRGLMTYLQQPASGSRAVINARINVASNFTAADDSGLASMPLDIFGPGDVNGFDRRIVVRTEPKNNVGDFEPNYFPFIEFAEPDFVWRFTANIPDANGNLKPWITLVVLTAEDSAAEGEKAKEILGQGFNPDTKTFWVKTDAAFLPNLSNSWRWAHVQVTGDEFLRAQLTDGNLNDEQKQQRIDAELKRILENEPERMVSRLLCARRLRPDMKYTAYVVPTFKLGVYAGLGQNPAEGDTALDLAWTASSGEVQLPYYFKWEFRTGMRGDFEHLVRLLEARPLSGLGKKNIDCGKPGFGLSEKIDRTDPDLDPAERYYLEFESAIKSTDTEVTKWGDDGEGDDGDEFQSGLSGLLNQTTIDVNVPVPHDFVPKIVAPVYGYFHRGTDDKVGDKHDWLDQLNLDPRHRYAAGLGTEIIKKNQEQLMASAWDQLGNIQAVNRILRNAQAGKEISAKIEKRLALLSTGDYLRSTAQVHGRILAENSTSTVRQRINESIIRKAPLDPALCRIARKRGAVRKRQNADFNVRGDMLSRLNERDLTIARERIDMVGMAKIGGITQTVLCDTTPVIVGEPVQVEQGGNFSYEFKVSESAFHSRVYLSVEDKPDWLELKDNGDGTFRLEGKPPAQEISGKQIKSRPVAYTVTLRLKERGGRANLYRQSFTINVCSRKQLSAAMACTRTFDNRYRRGIDAGMKKQTVWKVGNITQGAQAHPDFNIARIFTEKNITSESIKQVVAKMPMSDLQNRTTGLIVARALEGWLNPVKAAGDTLPKIESLDDVRHNVAGNLSPEKTIGVRINSLIKTVTELGTRKKHNFKQIMAAPEFDAPMYEELEALSKELLLRGIETVPQNTVALLETNRRFIEAYMCGLNHEFARELLWREYPTDQRGSCFRQFWDISNNIPGDEKVQEYLECYMVQKQLKPISEWTDQDKTGLINIHKDSLDDIAALSTDEAVELILKSEAVREALKDIPAISYWKHKLGDNLNDAYIGESAAEKLVLLVRGDLLKKYPNTVIYAVKGTLNSDAANVPDLPEYTEKDESGEIIYPLFGAMVRPDITFLGFNLTEETARTENWYFVFEERVSEARFGADVPSDIILNDWSDLGWHHFGLGDTFDAYLNDIQPDNSKSAGFTIDDWNKSSASIGAITMQKPVRIIVSTQQMLP